MPDDDDEMPHGFAFSMPGELFRQLRADNDVHNARGEERHASSLRWMEDLDSEGLMALRYILAGDLEDAHGNARWFDGMAYSLLRAKGVNPQTGRSITDELLGEEDGASGPA